VCKDRIPGYSLAFEEVSMLGAELKELMIEEKK
jgi:hypothetical protein